MSNLKTINEMLSLATRLNQIVAELEAKKVVMLQDLQKKAA